VDNVKAKLENQSLLQAPLYLLAAEKVFGARAAGVFYIGMRTGLLYAGWSESPLMESLPMPEQWLKQTRERALEIVGRIRAGKIDIAPADTGLCRFCDAKDVCRVETVKAPATLVQVENV
jgi:hypothetical protein